MEKKKIKNNQKIINNIIKAFFIKKKIKNNQKIIINIIKVFFMLSTFMFIGTFGFSVFMYSMMWHNIDLSHNIALINSCENLNYEDTPDGIKITSMATIYIESMDAINYWVAAALISVFGIMAEFYGLLSCYDDI